MKITYKNFISLLLFLFSFNLVVFADDDIRNKINQISVFDNKIPEDVPFVEKFQGGHPKLLDYAFVLTRVANLREYPGTNTRIITKYGYGKRLQLLERVMFQSNEWYKVRDEKGTEGYISANVVTKRIFRFELALDKVKKLENFINTAVANKQELYTVDTYVPNPSNSNIVQAKDKYGTTIDQNLVAVSATTGEKIFVPDRSVVKIISRGATTSRIKALSIPEELIVPNSKLNKRPFIKPDFRKVITVDLKNQNLMIFEKDSSNQWNLISYVYSKTGTPSAIGFETPRGYFTVSNGKFVMDYNDENGQKQGNARFALRFCGGGYLHGTPINLQEEVNREFYMKQKELTLGTYPGTRKCIRTTEPHAKFLFDWSLPKKNKNNNYQSMTENIYFIAF